MQTLSTTDGYPSLIAALEVPEPTCTAIKSCNDDAVLEFDELAARGEFPIEADEVRLLATNDMFREQNALIKTVCNDGWAEQIYKLQGSRFRTPVTIPPPEAKGMRLFGKVSKAKCGLVWDMKALDMSDSLMWPAGYYAKTEFNFCADGSLLNGRDEMLVTVDQIRQENISRTSAGEVMPYNEILAGVHGSRGLVAVFARTNKILHLIYCLGVRALLQRAFPELGELPVLVHDPEKGMRPFPRSAQRELIRHFIHSSRKTGWLSEQFGPIDIEPVIASFSSVERLLFHGGWGVEPDALEAILGTKCSGEISEQSAAKARGMVTLGLYASIAFDNPHSAEAIIRVSAPLLFTSPKENEDNSHDRNVAVLHSICQSALSELSSVAKRTGCLVAVGARIALENYATGSSSLAIADATKQLQEWLTSSSSISFRLSSWRDLRHRRRCTKSFEAPDPNVSPFITGKAVTNRMRFCDALLELAKCRDGNAYFACLSALLSGLHQPCLRLEMLKDILGLDDRYDRDAVAGVVNLALDIIRSLTCDTTARVIPDGMIARMLSNSKYDFDRQASGCLDDIEKPLPPEALSSEAPKEGWDRQSTEPPSGQSLSSEDESGSPHCSPSPSPPQSPDVRCKTRLDVYALRHHDASNAVPCCGAILQAFSRQSKLKSIESAPRIPTPQ